MTDFNKIMEKIISGRTKKHRGKGYVIYNYDFLVNNIDREAKLIKQANGIPSDTELTSDELTKLIKGMSRERLEEALLELTEQHEGLQFLYDKLKEESLYFENYLIKELGRETYMDMAKECSMNWSIERLQALGVSEKGIEDFKKRMGHKERVKN